MSIDLAAERLNKGHSIRSLSDELNVHQHAIRRLEAGGSVHPATAKKIADYYGVKVTDIMPLEREPAS